MAVAIFLVYQTIADFREKLKHPVMSVSYKEVPSYDAPGIALFPGKAELLTCKHHYYDYIPPLVNPGQPGEIKCTTQRVNYTAPFTNKTKKHAIVVEGPRDVKKRELVFMHPDKSEFMKVCESSYSSWKFSGGFRTWVKMSLVKTKEEDSRETVEFRQEISVVNYIERRMKAEGDQLFFVVFEWKDPFIQEVQDIVTANPWNMIALLCGIFLALFKAADFAKLSVKWMIKIRKRHLKRRTQVLNHIS
ncbi:hypothetical protein JD844_025261 [Phrynosoma platyrhinos]|uniref:Proton-activated chloride channel n=1 Tax=Phrynosoma platyrhinos TaxID=52577 RepID=A0ABQ7SZ96_PHRPL|nr:hypothetical protein JD844_025261 [Phrynosoma platyrhinos]